MDLIANSVIYTPARARLLVASFWLSFLASRLGIAFLQQQEYLSRQSDPLVVCTLALLATTPKAP